MKQVSVMDSRLQFTARLGTARALTCEWCSEHDGERHNCPTCNSAIADRLAALENTIDLPLTIVKDYSRFQGINFLRRQKYQRIMRKHHEKELSR